MKVFWKYEKLFWQIEKLFFAFQILKNGNFAFDVMSLVIPMSPNSKVLFTSREEKIRKTFLFSGIEKLCDNLFNPFWKFSRQKASEKRIEKLAKTHFFLSFRFEGESSRLLNLIKMQSSILRSAWQQQQHKRWQNNEKLFRDLVSNFGAVLGGEKMKFRQLRVEMKFNFGDSYHWLENTLKRQKLLRNWTFQFSLLLASCKKGNNFWFGVSGEWQVSNRKVIRLIPLHWFLETHLATINIENDFIAPFKAFWERQRKAKWGKHKKTQTWPLLMAVNGNRSGAK